jgi:acetyl esterase/lipase
VNPTRRGLGLLGAAALVSQSAGRAFAAGQPAAFDPTPLVNPELRPYLKAFQKTTGEVSAQTVAADRARAAAHPPHTPNGAVERLIAGPPGAPPVRIYLVNGQGKGAALRPAILHIHGGGFIGGSAAGAVPMLRALCGALDCVGVTVDYRLAPETRFPGALADNYAALGWLHRNAGELGVDPERIAVMGESAGGGHAAMLAIAARDRGEFPLAYQALIYPMLDDRTGSTRRTPPYQGFVIWTAQANRFGWTSLLGVPAGSRRVPYGSVPARVENLRGLPPAFIGVGSVDLFVDEDIEYARRLVDAGVQVSLNVVPGAWHAFDILLNTALAKQFRTDLLAALSAGLAPKPPLTGPRPRSSG